MDPKTTLWLEVSHHAAFRVGGWAHVRRDADGAVTGYAAGDRRIDLERTALTALIAALKDAPRPTRVRTASAPILAIPARLAAAKAGEDPPTENLDLWAQAMTALAKGAVDIVASTASDRTTQFAAAWAELGRDRGKDKGAFTSAIPKPNLAKAGL